MVTWGNEPTVEPRYVGKHRAPSRVSRVRVAWSSRIVAGRLARLATRGGAR